jgi:HAD superfamily hydrolase (TIGR01509 family)
MNDVQAVIFALDGVLIDSGPLHLRAAQAALGARGASYTERDSGAFVDASDGDLFRVLRILFDLDQTTEQLVAAKRQHLCALLQREGRPLPGVPEVPRRLREAGVLLGLVSTSAPPIVREALRALGLVDAFTALVSADEVPRSRPAPDALLTAARRLAVAPEHCLAVEDSRRGVLAARAAGMRVAAVPGRATGDDDLAPADLVLPSLEALPKVLGRNGASDHLSTSLA